MMKNATGYGRTRSKARRVIQTCAAMSIQSTTDEAATSATSRAVPRAPRPSRKDSRIASIRAPIFSGSGRRSGFTKRSVRSGFAARNPRIRRPTSVPAPKRSAKWRRRSKRPAASPPMLSGAHPTAYTTKRNTHVTRSSSRSRAIDARQGATGNPARRARATGRTISPARAGRSVEAAKPIEVAELRSYADGRPALRRRRPQRQERNGGVWRRPQAVARSSQPTCAPRIARPTAAKSSVRRKSARRTAARPSDTATRSVLPPVPEVLTARS